MKMTPEQKQTFFDQYGVMPITDDDIPEDSKLILTPQQIHMAEVQLKKIEARNYLNETDWYVSRKAETGVDIPADVLEKRAQARLDAK